MARGIGASLLVRVVGREEEGRVDVAVTRMSEPERRDAVALADLERFACHLAQPVEGYGDVLAEGTATLGEDREGRPTAPAPQLGHLRRLLRRVHGDGILRERLAQLARDTARLCVRPSASVMIMKAPPSKAPRTDKRRPKKDNVTASRYSIAAGTTPEASTRSIAEMPASASR